MSARGLLAKPTTRQVMVYICVFLYQGYGILFYPEAHYRILFYSVPDCLCFLLYNTHSYVEIICLLSSRQSSVALKGRTREGRGDRGPTFGGERERKRNRNGLA